MPDDHLDRPCLRAVEVMPTEHEGKPMLVLHDPAGWASGSLTLSEPVLFILSRCDGEHTLGQIQAAFTKQFGQMVLTEQLRDLVRQLEESHFLEGPGFEAYVAEQARLFRDLPTRMTMPDNGLGVELHRLPAVIKAIVAEGAADAPADRIVGLIAPHLDFRRGQPCYADAYKTLSQNDGLRRFVILGTNHFGRATSVVATKKDFETPLGRLEADRDFLDKLGARFDADLLEHELDHRREHSIEMQVLFLQHVYYKQPITFVPLLCPDPCGPTGTAPFDGSGVDLREFAEALGDLIAADHTPTCIIAGADLSHIGRRFGDDHDLDDDFLKAVEARDRKALACVEQFDSEAFRQAVADEENPTRVCSAGCIYTLMTSLGRAYGADRISAKLLRYHQAVNPEWDTGVTCAAVVFTLSE